MPEPVIPILSASFGALNTTFHFIELLYKIQGVPSEAKNFLKLISRVEKDVNDARRLRHDKAVLLNAGLAARVDEAILDTCDSMKEVGRTIETCRVDMAQKNGGVSVAHRFKWVLKDHQAFLNKERNLNYCHTVILHCISDMNALRAVDLPPYSPPSGGNLGYEEPLQSPRARRAKNLVGDLFEGLETEMDPPLSKTPAISVEETSLYITTQEAIYRGTPSPRAVSAEANENMRMPSPSMSSTPRCETRSIHADSDDEDEGELDDQRIDLILRRASSRKIFR